MQLRAGLRCSPLPTPWRFEPIGCANMRSSCGLQPMNLAELLTLYEERARVASVQGSSAPVASVFRLVLDELTQLDGIETAGRWFDTSEAAAVLSVSPKTVRKWCKDGRFPSARKTSGEKGDWRIPMHEVYENARGSNAKVMKVPKLWRPDE